MDIARFGDRVATGVRDVVTGAEAVEALATQGFWAVVMTFEGALTAVRFDEVRRGVSRRVPRWPSLDGAWRTSLDGDAYRSSVSEIRERIAAGTVYQANLCRVLEHDLDDAADLDGLDAVLRQGNPAPYACRIRVDAARLDLVSASPERFLTRSGERLASSPIKGTATSADRLLPKDFAENVMIVDLVRNDLSRVCEEGTVDVEALCAVEPHPGLVHLVSTVAGRLRGGVGWGDILDATFPPGSVSGAPKSSALTTIHDLEPVSRGPYCGAVGWVDTDRDEAELAVGIRTFWAERDGSGRRVLRFGTGAGITWGSDPDAEWAETELKAARLIGLAGAGRPVPERRVGSTVS
ncbi:MAG TPA: chorismate-binding protein [Lapillicoccus sp.]|nr:chorismate-binding protein [Lapillicoccus sp.]